VENLSTTIVSGAVAAPAAAPLTAAVAVNRSLASTGARRSTTTTRNPCTNTNRECRGMTGMILASARSPVSALRREPRTNGRRLDAAVDYRAMRRIPAVVMLVGACVIIGRGQESAPRQVRLTLHEGTNMAAALSPDGRTIAVDLLGTLWTL